MTCNVLFPPSQSFLLQLFPHLHSKVFFLFPLVHFAKAKQGLQGTDINRAGLNNTLT